MKYEKLKPLKGYEFKIKFENESYNDIFTHNPDLRIKITENSSKDEMLKNVSPEYLEEQKKYIKGKKLYELYFVDGDYQCFQVGIYEKSLNDALEIFLCNEDQLFEEMLCFENDKGFYYEIIETIHLCENDEISSVDDFRTACIRTIETHLDVRKEITNFIKDIEGKEND